jgi:hypothetical protein
MKRNLSITTAAAALLVGTVFAAAQGVQQRPGAGGAEPGMQQDGGKGKAQEPRTQGQGSQSQGHQGQAPEPKSKAQSKEPRTQGQGQGGQTQGQQGQSTPEPKSKAQSKEKEPGTRGQGGQGQRDTQGQREGQPQQQQGQQPKQQPQQGQQTPPRGGDTQKGAESKGGAQTSGVTLTSEQRTKIRTTVLQGSNAPRVTNVNFSLNVGTVVPRDRVRVVAVPATLVEIHPAWRGYMYFIVGEQIIIVEPSSYKIVAVLDV